ncbi:MAG: SGNH/GDSL hydrolase family protein [Planctomycetota bacterium]
MRRRRSSLRARLLLAAAVLLLPFVVTEVLLRPFVHTGGAVFVDDAGERVAAIDVDGPFPHPRAGLRGRLEAGEFSTAVAVDAEGRRCSARASEAPTADGTADAGIELIVVGDSFTFGWGVEFEQTFGALLAATLRERLPAMPIELTNLGCPGTGLHSQRLWLEQHLARQRPRWRRLVVWTVLIEHGLASGNDLIDNYNSLRPAPGDGGEHLTPEARRDQALSPGLLVRTKQFLSRWSVTYELVMRVLGSSLRRFAPQARDPATDALLTEAWADFGKELRAVEALAQQRDLAVVFGYVPYSRELAANDDSVFARLRAALPSALPLVSLLPGLRACAEPCSYPRDGHPTPAGHRAIADAYAPMVADVAARLR